MQVLKMLAAASASMSVAAASPTTRAPSSVFVVPLTGAAVTDIVHPSGGTGDPAGFGVVTLAIDPTTKQVCYTFRLSTGSEPMMAHIHLGPALRIGPPVVTLFTGTGSELEGCAPSTHSQLAAINSAPSNFYVSVDTTQYPDGAVRGQL